jgi:hypothetical protein
VRLGRDHCVRLDADDYSVHPSMIGRKVTATLTSMQFGRDAMRIWSTNIGDAGRRIRRSATPSTSRPPHNCVAATG